MTDVSHYMLAEKAIHKIKSEMRNSRMRLRRVSQMSRYSILIQMFSMITVLRMVNRIKKLPRFHLKVTWPDFFRVKLIHKLVVLSPLTSHLVTKVTNLILYIFMIQSRIHSLRISKRISQFLITVVSMKMACQNWLTKTKHALMKQIVRLIIL